MPDTSTCPHPDCEAVIPRERFACPRHWYTLPKELRSEIWRNYRSGDIDRVLNGYEKAEHYWETV